MRNMLMPNPPGGRRSGFTMVEAIVVMVLIGLVSASAAVTYRTSRDVAGEELTLVTLTAIAKQTLAGPRAASLIASASATSQAGLAELASNEGLPAGWTVAGDDGLAPLSADTPEVLQVAPGPQGTLHVAAVTPSGRCANVLATESGALATALTAFPDDGTACLDAATLTLDPEGESSGDPGGGDAGDTYTWDNDDRTPEDRYFIRVPWVDPSDSSVTDEVYQAVGDPGWVFRVEDTPLFASGHLLEVDVMDDSGTGAVFRWVNDRNFWLAHVDNDQLVVDVYEDIDGEATVRRVASTSYACPSSQHRRGTLSVVWTDQQVSVSGFAQYRGGACQTEPDRVNLTIDATTTPDDHAVHGDATLGGIAGYAGVDGKVDPDPLAALTIEWLWREPNLADPDLFPSSSGGDPARMRFSARPGPVDYHVGWAQTDTPTEDELVWTATGSDARTQTVTIDPPTDATSWWFVRPVNLDGTFGTAVSAPTPVPGRVTDLTVTDGPGVAEATIIWPAVEGATSYRVFHDDSAAFLATVSSPTPASTLGAGYDPSVTWYRYVTSLGGDHRIIAQVANTSGQGSHVTGRAGTPELVGIEYWLRQTETRTWGSWSETAFANSNCTTQNSATSQRECRKRTRTRSYGSWTAWGSYVHANCTAAQNATTERQCQPRTRTISSWSSWSTGSWSNSNLSPSISYTSEREVQKQSRTRSWNAWNTSDPVYANCSASASATSEAACRRRDRTRSYTSWSAWSTGSYAYSSCTYSDATGTTNRQCQRRTQTRSVVNQRQTRTRRTLSSPSGTTPQGSCTRQVQAKCQFRTEQRSSPTTNDWWVAQNWTYTSSCTGSSGTGTVHRRSCRQQYFNWGSWTSWSNVSSCTAGTSSFDSYSTQRECRTNTSYTAWSAWSYSGWMNGSCTNHLNGDTTRRQCAARTRTRGYTSWSSWSYTSWSTSSGCSGTYNETLRQRQCQRRTRSMGSWSSWSQGSWSATSSCTRSTSTTREEQCRQRTRTRSYSAWTSGTAGYSNCTSASGNVATQRQCRVRERTVGSWGSWSTTSFSLTTSCTRNPTFLREEQCSQRSRTMPAWTGNFSGDRALGSCAQHPSQTNPGRLSWHTWEHNATTRYRCRFIEDNGG